MNEAGRIETRSLAWTWLAGAWAFNLPWEIAQRPLYSGYQGFGPHLKGCFVASLGDVAIFAGLFGFMAAATGSRRWFEGSRARFLTLAAAGITLAAAIEYRALYLGKWSYSENMPLVPVLELGLSPVLQMVVGPVALALLSRQRAARNRGNAGHGKRGTMTMDGIGHGCMR